MPKTVPFAAPAGFSLLPLTNFKLSSKAMLVCVQVSLISNARVTPGRIELFLLIFWIASTMPSSNGMSKSKILPQPFSSPLWTEKSPPSTTTSLFPLSILPFTAGPM